MFLRFVVLLGSIFDGIPRRYLLWGGYISAALTTVPFMLYVLLYSATAASMGFFVWVVVLMVAAVSFT